MEDFLKKPEIMSGISYGRKIIEEIVMHKNEYCDYLEEIVNEFELFLIRFQSNNTQTIDSLKTEALRIQEKILKSKEMR